MVKTSFISTDRITQMKDIGTKREVLCRKAIRTKKGCTYETLTTADKKNASIAKRSEGTQNSPWRRHVVNFSKKQKISYATALSHPECKTSYVKIIKPPKTPKPKTIG